MTAIDRIRLEGIDCRCKVGVPDWERKSRQKVVVDVELELDLRRAGKTDDVRHTADYWYVEQRVRKAVQTGGHRLVERLAALAAEAALDAAPLARAVVIRVHKKPAVMPKTRDVVVEIRRAR